MINWKFVLGLLCIALASAGYDWCDAAQGDARNDGRGQDPGAGMYDNEFGWRWCLEPRKMDSMRGEWAGGGTFGRTETDDRGRLVVTLILAGTMTEPGYRYRPVAFDSAGRRHPLSERARTVMLSGGTRMAKALFLLPETTLAAGGVAQLGIEELTPEGRQRASARAIGRLQASGIQPLPLPRIGLTYEFTLTATDGKEIGSEDLRGKVVLIDCWATWCTPCMKKMPHLKALHWRWHDRGLEVVGVNYDGDQAKARRACESLGLPWRQVAVPGDEKTQELWEVASGISTLPRLLILDRSGVLRFDCLPEEMERHLAELLEGKPNQ
jgi:thiol-disulfide isomerase/thioredoxin